MIDNIVIGTPLVSLEALGVDDSETTVFFTFDEVQNEDGEVFLPALLKQAGLFQSTSQVRQVNKQRIKSTKITDELSRNLWRNLDGPEFTHFKIGKQVFWLIVGE
jgi:hypothetical protein